MKKKIFEFSIKGVTFSITFFIWKLLFSRKIFWSENIGKNFSQKSYLKMGQNKVAYKISASWVVWKFL